MKTETYTQKFEELSKIVKDLEKGDIAIDEMTEKIKKALVLIQDCKQSLNTVNEDVSKIIDEINIANDDY
ncbi:MAG: exodeoxyribonuclease VII small subunit [Bacteroidales bacterium]|nr:exodeoxyribonuclease VII small subunit [Bacteroidales bacterium]MDD4683775.1 exodeoxyribonuclease VII small subunit [Bacteroidales bacterium]